MSASLIRAVFPVGCFTKASYSTAGYCSPGITQWLGKSGLIINFTIIVEIHARSLANFYCQYADRHVNLKFMRRVSE